MIDPNALEQMNALCEIYKYRWGKEVDYTILPRGIDQEKMVTVLERIVDTGESILVGYNKLFLTNTTDISQ